MALVIGIVFVKNAEYQKTLDLGYDRDKLIVVPIAPEYFTSFRNEVLSNPKIISAEGTQNHIGFGGYRRPIKDEEKQLEVDVLDIGPTYAQTMGLRLVAGRLFDESRAAADRTNGSIVVNQKLVKDFGWKEAVGQTITFNDTQSSRQRKAQDIRLRRRKVEKPVALIKVGRIILTTKSRS
jgi:hypothetical protein